MEHVPLTPEEQERYRARYFFDDRGWIGNEPTGGYGYNDTQMFRDLEKAERDLKDERYVVAQLKKRLDTARDELSAAKALWIEVHTYIYSAWREENEIRIPSSIYERLNDLLSKGVMIEAG